MISKTILFQRFPVMLIATDYISSKNEIGLHPNEKTSIQTIIRFVLVLKFITQ